MKLYLLLLLTFARALIVRSEPILESTLRSISFDQKINSQVSLDLPFRDETGAVVRLGNYFRDKPVILVPGYYGCPMLCTLVLNGLIGTLQDLKVSVGDQFDIINFSINPSEGPALAAAKKRTYLRSYGRSGAATGWKFLTGDEASIQKLSGDIGFHYVYDPESRQYAHPSGFVVLTPRGRVVRYFFGVDYSADELDTALTAASANRVESPIRQLFLLCFHYSPLKGKYAKFIINTVRFFGAATVLGLGVMIGRSIARERRA